MTSKTRMIGKLSEPDFLMLVEKVQASYPRMRDVSIQIAHDFFVKGKLQVDIARDREVLPQNVSRQCKRLYDHLSK